MLRQFLIFQSGDIIFTHTYAIGLKVEELEQAKEIMEAAPMPGKTFSRGIGDFQIFHHQKGALRFSFIADKIDSLNYIDKVMKKVMNKFTLYFPNTSDFNDSTISKDAFMKSVIKAQHELHTKIAIIGPIGSGKTTLYNLLKGGNERKIMNFAVSSSMDIGDLKFDIWNIILKDNHTLLWAKFVGGADLIIIQFDASNYNLKLLSHFFGLKNREGKHAKLLILANKYDLIDFDDLKRIKSELNQEDIKEITINGSGAKAKMIQYFTQVFNLKRELPSNFEDLLKEANSLESEENFANALIKYKEIINICNSYQIYDKEKELQDKVNEIKAKLEKSIAVKEVIQRKKKFQPPGAIRFSKSVSVQTLPTSEPLQKSSSPPQIEKIKAPKAPSQPIGQTKSEKTPTLEILKPKPIVQKSKVKKLSLKASDINIDLSNLKKQALLQKNITASLQKRLTPKNEIKAADLKTDEDYVKALQIMLQQKGSDLSINLCTQYIEALKKMNINLDINNLKSTVELFIQREKENAV